MNESNPYSPPTTDSAVQGTYTEPPVFCLAMFIVSLVFCCLRLPLLALDLAGDSMGYDAAFEPTIIPGVASSAGIVVFGFTGNSLLLRRVAWGIPIGVCLILSVAASIGVDIWIQLISRSLPSYRATVLGEFVSIGLMLFRSVLLLLYCTALGSFRAWSLNSRRKSIQISI